MTPQRASWTPVSCDRRGALRRMFLGSTAAVAAIGGCVPPRPLAAPPDLVWGRRGISDGRFQKPRAIAIDRWDRLYIVDTTGRIQMFSADGEFLRGWKTPETANGRPTGLTVDAEDRLLVADTHYYRVLVYTLEGRLLPEKTIGGTAGTAPGQFAFVTDVARDSRGNYFIGDYGDADRVQKFSPEGTFLDGWGGTGEAPGHFIRPQGLAIGAGDRLWVADSCNHRIQAFDVSGPEARLVASFGSQGQRPGEFYYPYGLAVAEDGTLFVCEYGNQRIQHLSADGRSLGIWGGPGRQPGQLYQPWGVVLDSRGRLHILDSNNHRVQRVVV